MHMTVRFITYHEIFNPRSSYFISNFFEINTLFNNVNKTNIFFQNIIFEDLYREIKITITYIFSKIKMSLYD
jgi:hypothetical protein